MNIVDLEHSVCKNIEIDDLESALCDVCNYVNGIVHNELAIANIFGSKRLDELCCKIGMAVSSSIPECIDETSEAESIDVLVVASHLDKYGGHNKVVMDFLNAQYGHLSKHLVLTDIFDVGGYESLNIDVNYSVAPSVGYRKKTEWLISLIRRLRPIKIILFNHHHDAVAVSSVQPWLSDSKVHYYHHCDHSLALGVHLPNAYHIDPHNLGFFNCKTHEGIAENIYIPLFRPDVGTHRTIDNLCCDNLITASSGSYQPKFGVEYDIKYFEIVARRLKIRSGTHIHIGNLPDEAWDELVKVFDNEGIDFNRFVHIPWVDSLWLELVKQKVSLYISSFPVGGGLASIEAMGAAIPILFHQSYLGRFYSGYDMGYDGALRWSTVEDFNEIIAKIDSNLLKSHSREARKFYEKHHSQELLSRYLKDGPTHIEVQPRPLIPIYPDYIREFESRYDKVAKGVKGTLYIRNQELQDSNRKLQDVNINLHRSLAGLIDINSRLQYEYSAVLSPIKTKIIAPIAKIRNASKKIVSIPKRVYNKIITFARWNIELFKYFIVRPKKISICDILSLITYFTSDRRGMIRVYSAAEKTLKNFSTNTKLCHYSRIHKVIDCRSNITLIFDHNGGGGTNIYTKQQIEECHSNHSDVFRLWYYESVWFISYIPVNAEEAIYFVPSEKLEYTLCGYKYDSVIVNSFYGAPSITDLEKVIRAIVSKSNTKLIYKCHDYLAICPSPHLVDYSGMYCEIPSDLRICEKCLSKNNAWYHSWIKESDKPKTIDSWRSPFQKLMTCATEITVFDESSIATLQSVFEIDRTKFVVKEHVHNPFPAIQLPLTGDLHIGVIGTLSSIKGIKKVIEFANYIKYKSLNVELTVIGEAAEVMPTNVRVHGKYDNSELPAILKEYGVNAILMPSLVPETFSYSLSEAFLMGLPVVCFDMGAQSNRVSKYKRGKVISAFASSEEIYDAFSNLRD